MTRTDDSSSADESLLVLPDERRDDLKDPFGPVETDAETLLEAVCGPLITVGDVVTYHVLEADRDPDVAIVDGRTKREAVDEEIREVVATGAGLEVENPPATITKAALEAFREALDAEVPTTVLVDGEEDLLALPAIVAAPEGASVVYGQPEEGMVHVRVDAETREEVRRLLEGFEGDLEALWAILE